MERECTSLYVLQLGLQSFYIPNSFSQNTKKQKSILFVFYTFLLAPLPSLVYLLFFSFFQITRIRQSANLDNKSLSLSFSLCTFWTWPYTSATWLHNDSTHTLECMHDHALHSHSQHQSHVTVHTMPVYTVMSGGHDNQQTAIYRDRRTDRRTQRKVRLSNR